jgi:glycosyltransferase involved in cell wall biosynthesis
MEENTDSALSSQAWKHLRDIKTADILVGVPSYNNAHTINYVVYQAAKGLETHFPNLNSLIFISDGSSTDGTLETVRAMRLPFKGNIIPATYAGIPGKGSALKAVFEAACFLKVKAVAVVDSDLRSITPDWIRLLISPIMNGTGFVTPFYMRHKYDGTITNFLCYPLTSSLYGKRIRQPIGGDFGLSIQLIQEILESPLWQTPYVPRFGIDIFETHTALAKQFVVKQAFLGTKVHEAKDPAAHLAPMFRQVIGSMFTCIEQYRDVWKTIRDHSDVEIIDKQKYFSSPEDIQVNLQNLKRTYTNGFNENERVYRKILSHDLFNAAEELKRNDDAEIHFSAETWAKIVFSFLAGFTGEEQNKRERLLDALRILWIGKVASFVEETLEMATTEAEKKIEDEVRTFQELKPCLLSNID